MTIRNILAEWDTSASVHTYLTSQVFTHAVVTIVRPVRTATRFPSVIRGMNNAVKLDIREKLYANPAKDT